MVQCITFNYSKNLLILPDEQMYGSLSTSRKRLSVLSFTCKIQFGLCTPDELAALVRCISTKLRKFLFWGVFLDNIYTEAEVTEYMAEGKLFGRLQITQP